MTDLSATTNLSAMTARRFAEKNNLMASRATADLASGVITSDPSRAPSEAAVEGRLNAKLSNQATAQKNASQLTTMIQMGTGALRTVQDIVVRMQALTAQANSDGIDDASRAMLDQEYQQLLAQIDKVAQTTRWGDVQLFNGAANSATTASGVVAEALSVNAVANGFTAAYNAGNTQGVIDGTVTDATVSANGGMYDVRVVIGSKTFAATVAAPTIGGTLTLINTRDATSTIGFNYDGTAVTALNTAANFQSALRAHLGVDTGAKSVGTSSSIAMYTNATVTAGTAAASGTYGLTYTVSGTTGTFRISDGNTVATATVTAAASITQTVTVGNFSIALAAFNGSATLGQAAFGVTNTSNLSMAGQIDSESGDTLTVTFNSANTSALALNGTSITTKANAVTAQNALKAAASTVNNLVAQLGGKRSQLDFQIETLKISQANNAAAKSTFADVNIAEATDRLMKFKALSSMSQSVFSQAIQDSQKLADMLRNI